MYDIIAGLSQKLIVGDVSVYGLGKPTHSPSYDTRRGKIPVIDIGTLDQIKAGNITVLPGIRQINAKTVTFTDGPGRSGSRTSRSGVPASAVDSREISFDAIILATGYRPALGSILGDELASTVLNERGYPKKLWFGEATLQGLYFLGFSIPVTGVLYRLTIDSEQIACHIAENNFISL